MTGDPMRQRQAAAEVYRDHLSLMQNDLAVIRKIVLEMNSEDRPRSAIDQLNRIANDLRDAMDDAQSLQRKIGSYHQVTREDVKR